jgi:DNA-binding CsgD family transcriptional regulator
MDDSQRLLKSIDLLYASILDDAQWPAAMKSLAELAGASGTFYFTADQKRGSIIRSESEGVDPAVRSLYSRYYATKEIRLTPALAFPIGVGFTDDALVERQLYERSEIFGDLLTPYDIPHIFGVWVTKGAVTASAFVFERSSRQGVFGRNDAERCTAVLPHLVRALHVREALEGARQQQQIYGDVLDQLPFGTIFLDHSLRVIEASSAARKLFTEKSALSYTNGRVRAALSSDDRQLQRAINRATRRPLGEMPGDSIRVRRRDDGASLHVSVLPVRSRDSFADTCPAAILFVFDPAADVKPAVAVLRKALRLTEAEALLACVLFTGITLREAADQLHLSINTCKSQLKAIYVKTGCRSHVDLAKTIFMASVPGLA